LLASRIKRSSFLFHQPSKKSDAPTPDDEPRADAAPVSKAGEKEKKTDTPVKKRK
jgi:hypothetical protein